MHLPLAISQAESSNEKLKGEAYHWVGSVPVRDLGEYAYAMLMFMGRSMYLKVNLMHGSVRGIGDGIFRGLFLPRSVLICQCAVSRLTALGQKFRPHGFCMIRGGELAKSSTLLLSARSLSPRWRPTCRPEDHEVKQ